MRIGVTLCTYNGERYLQEQLDSILAQTRLPDAMLVQDDGSIDRTLAILETYVARAPFGVQVVRNSQNLGFVRNFEQAISRSSGDVVVLCDQDDYWLPDKLLVLEREFLSDRQAAAISSDAEMVNASLEPLGYRLLQALNVSAGDIARIQGGDMLGPLLRRNIAPGSALAFRGEWKNRLLPIPDGGYHDEWIALVAAAFGRARFLPEPLIKYRQHAGNLLGAQRRRVSDRVRGLLRSDMAENGRRLKVMKALQQRLFALGAPDRAIRNVEGKLKHLEVRTSLPSQRYLRLTSVASELVSGRYRQYSSGIPAALRDLLSPAA